MSTAISYDVVRCDDWYSIVFELVDANTLGELLTEDDGHLEELGAWVSRVEYLLEASEADEIRAFIVSVPDRNTFLHGDLNRKNVMLRDNGEFVFVDIGDAGLGHAVFDVGSVMMACLELGNFEVSYEEKTRMLGLNPKDSKALWPIVCETYFDLDDSDEVDACSNDLMVYGRLVECYQNTRLFEGDADAMREKMLPDIRENLLPLIRSAKPLTW